MQVLVTFFFINVDSNDDVGVDVGVNVDVEGDINVIDGVDADVVRKVILENFDMSLGTGLGKLKGKIFRIGHLGEINELTLIGALSGVEMGLSLADVPHQKGGVARAMAYLTKTAEG